ncbi:imidazole glycerol phosphate synthase subunit HisF [Gallaecimonas pentaromativorans]|uniref:Imidazole glycerol phosphate synthase subunit HisF n=1 Tax=Gallaecimonas pentaromativorans TaxID=584787 RepID=A0A3N1PN26_9GAMM|nr:imidazole glycerol phosphate synthase subunit HisF [Gallaecimonas pentaromativorans]ROQ30125.1 cyclase [Gallaecimonas pentaromativorans]
MLAKRIIPCLDVRDGVVVKGVQFKNHEVVGNIVELAQRYSDTGADELVFYDITASSDSRVVDKSWVSAVAEVLDIPFCVAGGIRSVEDARTLLAFGADKISVNSPALENPDFINQLSKEFGRQCVVVGIDSYVTEGGELQVWQYTGREDKARTSGRATLDWVREVEERGAGEIVLNMMNQDGMRKGYDLKQLAAVRAATRLPLIASGGAGQMHHFKDAFEAGADGALAASVFHKGIIAIPDLKAWLIAEGQEVRP